VKQKLVRRSCGGFIRRSVWRACHGEVPMLFIGTKTGQSKITNYAKQTQFQKNKK
jgi:hypothetical protein